MQPEGTSTGATIEDEATVDEDVPSFAPVADIAAQLAHAEDQWRLAAADLDNLQKRYQRELARGREAERERVARRWIDTLDDLERAVAADENGGIVVEGIRAIVAQAVKHIEDLGYPRFGAVGDRFDASLHEAVGTVAAAVDADAPDEEPAPFVIVAVVRHGYGTPDRLLRPAAVIVAAPES